LEVSTIYKGISPQNMALYGTNFHFRILEFPLIPSGFHHQGHFYTQIISAMFKSLCCPFKNCLGKRTGFPLSWIVIIPNIYKG
jgi:hypothetical protein